MTLRHLKIFVAVCDCLNMTTAAESLFMSQSAVSQTIAELEKHYASKLFERLSKKLYLTQAGHKLLSYARHILRLNADMESDMTLLHQNGSIRIGASVTVGAYVLPKLVAKFLQAISSSTVEVVEDNTARIEKMILLDQIDIGLVEGETTSPEMISRPFLGDELLLICGIHHRFANQSEIDPQELEHENFIIREKGSGTRKTFEDTMTAHQIAWKSVWTCSNTDTIKMAVSEGLGVSVMSRRAVANEVAQGILKEISMSGIRFDRQFKLVYHKNKYFTEHMRHFTDSLFQTTEPIRNKN